ncbi:MAG: FMN-binding protein [Lachnospiraceae bacterium]|nr:FMN-binding protein [Lachnospiraceae bacterium]
MIKDKKKKLWWHRVLTVIMAISIGSHIVTWVVDFNDYQQKVSNIVFKDMELANIKDGVYEGEYDAGYIYVRVEVEIRNNEIVSITLLEHRNERGKPAESILDDVVAKQEIDVDAVSGATNSSNVIKKAIENAVEKAK